MFNAFFSTLRSGCLALLCGQAGTGAWARTTATYDVFTDAASGTAVDVGVKAKFATADKRNDLVTTGKNDYSLLVDALRPFDATHVFATLGWTRKGDPEGIDYRNPRFGTVGLSRKLGGTVTLGGYYDYR